jgi:hypothetical protein
VLLPDTAILDRRRHGGAFQCVKTLLRHKLVHHENQKYDGYRLTYMGYDFLAIKTLVNRGHIASVGRQVGVGKESDIFEVQSRPARLPRLLLLLLLLLPLLLLPCCCCCCVPPGTSKPQAASAPRAPQPPPPNVRLR